MNNLAAQAVGKREAGWRRQIMNAPRSQPVSLKNQHGHPLAAERSQSFGQAIPPPNAPSRSAPASQFENNNRKDFKEWNVSLNP